MAFENNEFLQGLQGVNQSLGDLGAFRKQLEQQRAQQSYQQQAGELLQGAGVNPQYAAVAQQALAAGDPTIIRNLMEQQFKPADTSKVPIGEQQATILAQGLGLSDPDLITAAKDLPLPQAQAYFNSARASRDSRENLNFKGRGLDLAEQSLAERKEKEVQRQREVFKKDIKGVETLVAEQQAALGAAKAALASGLRPGQAVVENFIIRGLAGDKGPLSDNDRASVASKAGFNDFQSALNYFTGVPSSTWTDDQTAAFGEMVAIAERKQKSHEAKLFGDVLGQSDLLVKLQDRENSKLVEKYVKKYGFERKGEGYEKVVEKIDVPLVPETPADKLIEALTDPVTKQKAKDAMQRLGKKIPKSFNERLIKLIKEERAGK